MTTWYGGNVNANGIRLHYHRTGGRTGNGRPALVIAHGISAKGIGWSRVARALEGDHDVIMYDMRGHGLSEAPETGYMFSDHANDLAALIAALGLERPRVLGHSGGAMAAALAAADHADLFAGLILVDPAWGSGWGPWESVAAELRQWFLAMVTMTREELAVQVRTVHPHWSEQEQAVEVDSMAQVSPKLVQIFDQPEPPWREALPKIACPILLIAGDLETGDLITPEDVRVMSGLWRDGRVVQIEGAGHSVHRDRYEPFIATVQAFLVEI
jgi:pimeloyl-ACP methyl ester carboxylesterase